MRQANDTARTRKDQKAIALAVVSALCFGTVGCGNGGSGSGSGSGSVSAGSITSAQDIGSFRSLEVYPTAVTVDNDINSGFQVAVDGVHSNATVDVTRDASYTVADTTIAQISGDGLITPLANGTTQITVEYRGRTSTVDVTVVAPSGTAPNLVALSIYPAHRNMPMVVPSLGIEQYQQLVVVAEDDTGRLWDLTRSSPISVVDGNNMPTNWARVSSTGLLRAVADGEVLAVSRITNPSMIAGSRFILGAGPDSTPVDTTTLYSGEPLASSQNPIDQAVVDNLFRMLIEPAPLADDGEFLRRLYADALGRTPTEAEYMAFTTSTDPAKREAEIDAVLADPAFADKWAGIMGEWFEIRRNDGMAANATAFDNWARTGISAGTPLADMVTELATGQVPAFETQHDDAAKKVDVLVLAGAGMTAKCAVCHNHPMTGPTDTIAWDQLQRYGLDAFFATAQAEAIPLDKDGVRSGNNGQPVQPSFVFDATANVTSTLASPIADRRAEFAALFTGSDAFNRGMGHRIFAELCGELLNPNQFLEKELGAVTVPNVLDRITQTFAADTSLKGFMKTLFSSQYYQLTSAAADTAGDSVLARRVLRRHDSETLEDCIETVTGMGFASGADEDFFREVFGFPFDRESIAERVNTVNMSQAFLLMNSPVVQNRVTAGGSNVATLATQVGAGTITVEDAVRTLYRTTLTREPDAGELAECVAVVNGAGSVAEGLQDVSAVLMSTTEFVLR
jgi:hypothetical protein